MMLRKELLVVFAASLSLMACNERSDAFYKNLEIEAAQKAATQGWLPSFLPRETIEIYHDYEIDANHSVLSCKIPVNEAKRIVETNQRISAMLVDKVSLVSNKSWWPKYLQSGKLAELEKSGYKYFRIIDDRKIVWMVAINDQTGQLYAWC